MKICIVRHGETDWNRQGRYQGKEDIPLNEAGVKQVQEAAEYLKQFTWDAVITSPLSRAKLSAEIIRREVRADNLFEEAGFRERDLGKISGMTKDEADKKFPDKKEAAMEPPEKLRERTMGALRKWIKEFDGRDIIIVSHGSAINSMLPELDGHGTGPGKEILKNAGITLLEKQNGSMKIKLYNKTAAELPPNAF